MLKGTHNQDKCITINYKFYKNRNSKNKLKELNVQKKLREKMGVSLALISIREDGKWRQMIEKKNLGICNSPIDQGGDRDFKVV